MDSKKTEGLICFYSASIQSCFYSVICFIQILFLFDSVLICVSISILIFLIYSVSTLISFLSASIPFLFHSNLFLFESGSILFLSFCSVFIFLF